MRTFTHFLDQTHTNWFLLITSIVAFFVFVFLSIVSIERTKTKTNFTQMLYSWMFFIISWCVGSVVGILIIG